MQYSLLWETAISSPHFDSTVVVASVKILAA